MPGASGNLEIVSAFKELRAFAGGRRDPARSRMTHKRLWNGRHSPNGIYGISTRQRIGLTPP
jgi:hypothetical protein